MRKPYQSGTARQTLGVFSIYEKPRAANSRTTRARDDKRVSENTSVRRRMRARERGYMYQCRVCSAKMRARGMYMHATARHVHAGCENGANKSG
jgi:hypothetical protein